jgi:hypothetical protein
MTDLSSSAQAVLDAFWKGLMYPDDLNGSNIAAALRAAAEQLSYARGPGLVVDVDDILAIATELEAYVDD